MFHKSFGKELATTTVGATPKIAKNIFSSSQKQSVLEFRTLPVHFAVQHVKLTCRMDGLATSVVLSDFKGIIFMKNS